MQQLGEQVRGARRSPDRTILVVSADLAVRSVVCDLVASLGARAIPVPAVAEMVARACDRRRPVALLLDGRALGMPVDAFRRRVEAARGGTSPPVSLIRSAADPAGFPHDLRAEVARVIAAEPAPDVLPRAEDVPTLDGRIAWDEVAIERVHAGDLIAWPSAIAHAAAVTRVEAIRPLALGTMAGWVIDGTHGLMWFPAGARVARPRM